MTNNARIGGILSIVAGGLGAIMGLLGILGAILMAVFGGNGYYYDYYDYYYGMQGGWPMFFIVCVAIWAFFHLIISALAIIGGVYSIKKKSWGLALAGSIAAVIVFFLCGIPAVIFTALGKNEFKALPPVSTPQT
jgi:hypothetical protein